MNPLRRLYDGKEVRLINNRDRRMGGKFRRLSTIVRFPSKYNKSQIKSTIDRKRERRRKGREREREKKDENVNESEYLLYSQQT